MGILGQENENGLAGQNSPFFNDSKEIKEYIVEKGDTLSSLSQKFGISTETIIWANNLNKNSSLKVGQKLIILPISGVLHYVKNGDTLEAIAKTYKADLSEIIAFNELSSKEKIYIGDILIIPNGVMPQPSNSKLTPIQEQPLASSYFIVPVSSPYIISQGLHWYNAVDFTHAGGACGKPVLAAAGGQVLKISYGWNMGAGNYLKILHPNGVITMYGHLQTILVKEGDNVFQGQMIALIGGQPGTPGAGKSTGCHLHFSVQGAKNPFAK
ncbi:MAG: M23 family metallopeptidase [Candidatus Aenigmatarchaeota archaeon]